MVHEVDPATFDSPCARVRYRPRPGADEVLHEVHSALSGPFKQAVVRLDHPHPASWRPAGRWPGRDGAADRYWRFAVDTARVGLDASGPTSSAPWTWARACLP